MSKRWIWEFDNYPNFTYDKEELNSLIQDIVFLQGSLSSIVSFASKETLEEKLKDSYADEVINSSDIEGEFLNRNSVQWLSEEKLPYLVNG
jgi:Fic family protein